MNQFDPRQFRRKFLEIAVRRAQPGSGSNLLQLSRPSSTHAPTPPISIPISSNWALAGAYAANKYMPPRNTGDIDIVLIIADLDKAEAELKKAQWKKKGNLTLVGGLKGSAWKDPQGQDWAFIGLPGEWGRFAIEQAQKNKFNKVSTLTKSFIVAMKIISSRGQDLADITRMLGRSSKAEIDRIKKQASKAGLTEEDLEDIDQMAALGALEYL